MAAIREIRADYDSQTIVVYQAYSPAIARPAIEHGRFQEPFSWNRMTWIKPSFLWLMARSNWGEKSGQEFILAVRIKRSGWEEALSAGVLASFQRRVHPSSDAWRQAFADATVHVQWDPERSLQGKKLEHRSIQVGLSRHVIRQFTDEWIVEIRDLSPTAKRIRQLVRAGEHARAKRLLPPERVYEVPASIRARLDMHED